MIIPLSSLYAKLFFIDLPSFILIDPGQQPGMGFSVESNISIVGEFGVRHEDCVCMTADGPKWFSQPGRSIGEPFA
jgi:hypothetical protein